jgi:pimeloyl-ACP methyl ester carboxylesterase
VSVFRDLLIQHLDEHGSLIPIVQALSGEDFYPRLGEIALPTVVMSGTADRTTLPLHSRRLAAGIPGAQLVTIPGAGHLLNWEAPDELVKVVESFSSKRD